MLEFPISLNFVHLGGYSKKSRIALTSGTSSTPWEKDQFSPRSLQISGILPRDINNACYRIERQACPGDIQRSKLPFDVRLRTQAIIWSRLHPRLFLVADRKEGRSELPPRSEKSSRNSGRFGLILSKTYTDQILFGT